MLILGILAAIAIPAFFSQREKATDAQAKAAGRTAETAMESYATENGGSYEGATNTRLHEIGPTLQTEGDNAITVESEEDTFTVTSTSGKAHEFSITRNSNGTVTFSCSPEGSGGCPKDEEGGDWSK